MEERCSMELILTHQTKTEIGVICDGHLSHIFDLQPLLLENKKDLMVNAVVYGKKLYEALFPVGTQAQQALVALLDNPPGYLLMVAIDSDLEGIPWEYAY